MAQQETSALFSLNELMRLEEDRVRQEHELCRRQAEEAARARREAERAAREQEQARLRALEEHRLEEQARRRDEDARIEAIRAAEIERARVEAEERTRSEARAAERVHEQKLALLAADATKSRLRRSVWVGVAVCAALFAAGPIVYFGRIKPDADQRARSLQGIVDAQRAQRERLQRELDAQTGGLLDLQDRMRREQGAPKGSDPPPSRPTPWRASPPVRKVQGPVKAAPCTCDPHDPLCGCFASPH
jgi:colicin import membrane protein